MWCLTSRESLEVFMPTMSVGNPAAMRQLPFGLRQVVSLGDLAMRLYGSPPIHQFCEEILCIFWFNELGFCMDGFHLDCVDCNNDDSDCFSLNFLSFHIFVADNHCAQAEATYSANLCCSVNICCRLKWCHLYVVSTRAHMWLDGCCSFFSELVYMFSKDKLSVILNSKYNWNEIIG